MKSSELLKLYKEGCRDFEGVKLRGQNFKGTDLSDSSFSGADIRGTNFTNANLKRASFTYSKCGLQRRWLIGLLSIPLMLSLFAGILSFMAGYVATLGLTSTTYGTRVAGWAALFTLTLLSVLIFRKGILMGTFASGISVSILFASAIFVSIGASLFTSDPAELGGYIGVFFFTVTLASMFMIAVVFSMALTITTAFGVAGAAASVSMGVVAFAFLNTLAAIDVGTETGIFEAIVMNATLLVSSYFSWRVLKGDERESWIKAASIAFSTIGGTSFRGADLTDADFSHARFKGTDFRRSQLIRTCWKNAKSLKLTRPGNTYLSNPKVQKLLVTGDGEEQSFRGIFNLQGLYLKGANLVKTDFSESDLKNSIFEGADLSNIDLTRTTLFGVSFQNADLSNAKLIQAQLDQSDLSGATMTGAYIGDWNITTLTQISDVRCDYIFMRSASSDISGSNLRRKPDDWKKNFSKGEFVDFIMPIGETLDLYHNETVNPCAAALAFHNILEQYSESRLEIVSIEKRGTHRNKILLRAKTSSRTSLSELHSAYFKRYNHLLTLSLQALQKLIVEENESTINLANWIRTATEQHSQRSTTRTEGEAYLG